ncbi:hypothetical protein D918_02419 [Trichuris suis]|nr:hypothetical protein D918_02419 [Trichuris suis]
MRGNRTSKIGRKQEATMARIDNKRPARPCRLQDRLKQFDMKNKRRSQNEHETGKKYFFDNGQVEMQQRYSGWQKVGPAFGH